MGPVAARQASAEGVVVFPVTVAGDWLRCRFGSEVCPESVEPEGFIRRVCTDRSGQVGGTYDS